jgi:predicted secreted protein
MHRLITLVSPLLLVAACAGTLSGPPAVENGELTNAADGTVIAIRRGGELKVVLDTNPTVTIPWEGDANVGPALAPIGQRIYVGKGMNSYDIAAGGFNIFRYRAEQPGKVTLRFASRRPGESAPSQTVHYEVTVQ